MAKYRLYKNNNLRSTAYGKWYARKSAEGLVQLGADAPLPPMKKETRILWCELVLAMATVECGLKTDDREALRYPMAKAWNTLY